MIRRNDEINKIRKPSPFQGLGEITVRELLNGPEEMYHQGRVFAHTTVYPGSAIGYHIHDRESETYYILSGKAKYNDNGSEVILHPGDVAFTGTGEGHGIEAMGEEPVEMIALILYLD
ncbi:MAG: cupin domain-containing protein [Lachnospiraceae bacterium]|nr:cupin domain-containing protein [Lachnospiraceae bacterium]